MGGLPAGYYIAQSKSYLLKLTRQGRPTFLTAITPLYSPPEPICSPAPVTASPNSNTTRDGTEAFYLSFITSIMAIIALYCIVSRTVESIAYCSATFLFRFGFFYGNSHRNVGFSNLTLGLRSARICGLRQICLHQGEHANTCSNHSDMRFHEVTLSDIPQMNSGTA